MPLKMKRWEPDGTPDRADICGYFESCNCSRRSSQALNGCVGIDCGAYSRGFAGLKETDEWKRTKATTEVDLDATKKAAKGGCDTIIYKATGNNEIKSGETQ